MSYTPQLPVSALIRQGERLEDAESQRRSKDDYRKQKNLEEERKAGTAAAMVDIETGRDINPHIPEFIEKTPWYVPTAGPTLKHQRPHPEREQKLASIHDFIPKGTTDKVAFKYRDGACENCGAMGHTKKACFEKPRSLGAKWTNTNIAADDHVLPELKMGYDAKRDRWGGYDSSAYKQVHEEYERMEETRKMIKSQNMKDGIPDEEVAEGAVVVPEEKVDEDDDRYADDMGVCQAVDMDSRTRITVRNLRIREDTAKYLYNLNDNSAHYDPKSRSMRENPFQNMPGTEQQAAKFAGENFIRYTGEVVKANEAQVFAWSARCQGVDVHALAEPTKLEALKREYEKEKNSMTGGIKKDLVDKYGGEEYLKNAPPKELLLAQTEAYVEYNRTGKVVKGQERAAVKSRYDEDVLVNNHTSVWGSYWRDDKWGYACCHEFVKNSYCLGEEGIKRRRQEDLMMPREMKPTISEQRPLPADPKPTRVETIQPKKVEETEEHSDDEEEKGSVESDIEAKKSGVETSSSEETDEETREEREREREVEKERRMKSEKKREARRNKRRRQKERRKDKPKSEKGKRSKESRSRSTSRSSDGSSSGSDSDSDVEKVGGKVMTSEELKKAIRKVKQEAKEGKKMIEEGDRKRKYHSNVEVTKPTEAEKEAYNLTRIHSSDPMAAYIGQKASKKSKKQ
ncbi:pre-mRNA splicing prp18-interacting factor domain-containing protein [Ditylenchus destructor]|nr:pre-mRNA splicing prp18-interacting factor domain-containing protein [Ditylenchus destructor]